MPSEQQLSVGPQAIIYNSVYEFVPKTQWPYLFENNYIQQYRLDTLPSLHLPNRTQYLWESLNLELKHIAPAWPLSMFTRYYHLRFPLHRTVGYAQWATLNAVYDAGAPVSEPVGLRVVQGGLFHYAALLTCIPISSYISLSQAHANGGLSNAMLEALGDALRKLHSTQYLLNDFSLAHCLYSEDDECVIFVGAEQFKHNAQAVNFVLLKTAQVKQLKAVKKQLGVTEKSPAWQTVMHRYCKV